MKQLNYNQLVDLLSIVEKEVHEQPHLRAGQSLFNNLIQLYPEFDASIRATEYDPFYNDATILKCLSVIASPEARKQFVFSIFKSLKQ